MLAYQVITQQASDAGDVVGLLGSVVVTVGVCVTAAFGYLGVRSARAAKSEAVTTRTENASDHGRVRDALDGLRAEVVNLRADIHSVGQNVGSLRDQFVDHLQHHIDKDGKP